MAEFLPIRMFKQRVDDNQRVEGGGGDSAPKWYLQGEDLQRRSQDIASDFMAVLATPRRNPQLPYILRGTLAEREKINIMDFPMPTCLVRDGVYTGQIILTLGYNPLLDASQGGEYCQSDINVMFGSFEEKRGRDTTKPTILNPIGRTDTINLLLNAPFSKRRLKEAESDFALKERMLIEFAGKYSPVKKYAVDLDDLTDKFKEKVGEGRLWYLQLVPLFRHNAEAMALRTGEVLEQEFCLIITIRDPLKAAPVYNEVAQLLDANNFVHSPVHLRNEARVHIGS